ncbi:MAG: prepilin peptidase [Polyangiaceae bacterium]
MTLDLFPLWFLRTFAALFGLLWGSFLNVVIYRVPRGMSVVSPPSHCPHCKKPIRGYQNIPVLTWVVLRGRSACCKQPISPRYPMVELIGGVLSAAILELGVLTLPLHQTTLAKGVAIWLAGLALALGLVATAFVDMEHLTILPDKVNIAAAILGIATTSFRGLVWYDGLVGGFVGLGIGWGINSVYKMLRGRTGFASGDTVLLGVLGAWFGWRGALFGLLAGSIQGSVVLILVRIFGAKVEEPEEVRKEREEILAEIEKLPESQREAALEEWRKEDELADGGGEGMQAPVPFGPFIALAGIELLLFSGPLGDLYYLWAAP